MGKKLGPMDELGADVPRFGDVVGELDEMESELEDEIDDGLLFGNSR